MFVRIENSSATPIYRQLMDQIKYQIASGALGSGSRLPSVRDLARQLPANQNTVLKAYDLLAREGVLSRRQGDGTYVASVPPALKKSQRRKQVAEILSQAVVQAIHFEISAPQLRQLLDEQIEKLTAGGQFNESE